MTLTRRHFLLGTGGAAALVLAAGCSNIVRPSSPTGPTNPTSTAPPPGGFEVTHTDVEWHALLPPDRYGVLREADTEPPFSSPLDEEQRPGTFGCAGCGLDLFSSTTKFDSGTGWPSFWQPLPNAVLERNDSSLGMARTEVLCRRCGGHLGHVFKDGPKPTGLRYCMNGLALTFRPT